MANKHAEEIVTRISGGEGLLGAVPALLGFHPTESLVIMCTNGEPRRVGPVARIDLTQYLASPQPVARSLAAAIAPHADAVIIVSYTDGPQPGVLTLADILEDAGLHIADIIHTGNNPHAVDEALAAAKALHGRATLASRDELAQSIQHQPAATPTSRDQEIWAAMAETQTRDEYLADHIEPGQTDQVAPMIQALQATADEHPALPNLAAVAATIAYRNGDGALAQSMIARCLAADPTHGLGTVIRDCMNAGLPPKDLDDLALIPRT